MANLEENQRIIVASFTDAWIETRGWALIRQAEKSHLLQMRGLKPYGACGRNAGAPSHLLQMRGLKPFSCDTFDSFSLSHLLQMRGLKQCKDSWWLLYGSRIFYRCVDWNFLTLDHVSNCFVASFTDAWIETFLTDSIVSCISSHLLQMRGLKHLSLNRKHHRHGRIFYRCVDWNRFIPTHGYSRNVASFTDAWIET